MNSSAPRFRQLACISLIAATVFVGSMFTYIESNHNSKKLEINQVVFVPQTQQRQPAQTQQKQPAQTQPQYRAPQAPQTQQKKPVVGPIRLGQPEARTASNEFKLPPIESLNVGNLQPNSGQYAPTLDNTYHGGNPHGATFHGGGINRQSALAKQTKAEADAKSSSCAHCHQTVKDPHFSKSVTLGCTDCHGGDADCYEKDGAHIKPRFPGAWNNSGNPVRSYALLNKESPEFIRFVNPGDLRIAHIACGSCHQMETVQVKKSMMTHGCMLWGAALYNNGAVPFKWSRYGESYSMNGKPQRLQTVPPPTAEETARKGILPFLDPLPRFQITQPGNVLRVFEKGGRFIPEPAIPEVFEEPGRPRTRLSNRGLGTGNRTDPTMLGLQKTRLLDPTLNFMGTNDHPGDYRSSGCTSCHVVYANDRSPVHSGPFAKYGHLGKAAGEMDDWVKSVDPMIPKNERGHPIQHRFTRAIPTSQCIVCHIHPGTTVINSYLGYMWWDQETDGHLMYPKEQKHLTSEEYTQATMYNPNEGAARGKWTEPDFLENVVDLNPQLEHTQFADFNGHGWVFRAVFKKDRKGNLLDHQGEKIEEPSNEKLQLAILMPQYAKQLYQNRDWTDPSDMEKLMKQEEELEKLREQVPVHMLDVHIEKGMHCVDCHFVQDVHGNTKLYGEVRAAIEITCRDCHGDIDKKAWELSGGMPVMRTTGPAAKENPDPKKAGMNLLALRNPDGKRRFEIRNGKLIQNSMVEKGVSWEVTQVTDTIDPSSHNYNAASALAKTARIENGAFAWGDVPNKDHCAHSSSRMSCISCHSSWNQSCYGCHLPQKANRKTPDLHNEGDVTRNHISYNFQTLRDEVYMLAKDGNVTNNRIGPARSSCAIHVSSYSALRESIYVQQQTISGEGLSGIAFSTNVPHTVRGKGETKNCTDCHISAENDNNALLAQLQMQGTNYLNFIGRYCWVAAGEEGFYGVIVTEQSEPQAVIGSHLHELAFPEHYEEHIEHHKELEEAHEHPGIDIGQKLRQPFHKHEVLSVQARGEYLYTACGEDGVRIYDIANIDNKSFSERIVTAPFSPLGQKFFVKTKNARQVVAPTTIAPDPTREHRPENFEQKISLLFAFIYVADAEEGMVMINVGTLLDGNPENNFVKRDITFNPNGILHGAESINVVGNYAYVCCDAGLVVVSLEEPTKPKVVSVVGNDFLKNPRDIQIQFRYAFVCDDEGLKVLDVTDLANPVPASALPIRDARKVYVARTYAYVAGGHEGLIIVDVENPTKPKIDQVYNGDGHIKDLHDVKLGITYTSEFAYLADGCHGVHVVQLTSPEVKGNGGFSPKPKPKFIATYHLHGGGEALAIAEGIDRDRAVDESGNQLAVFGRVGARPFNKQEQEKLYKMPNGRLYSVIDGKRKYAIKDPKAREADLKKQLEAYYGTARPYMTRSSNLSPRIPFKRKLGSQRR